jgi:peptidoglycan L-alanyl-D-glutamate endopeptidase CwlK
MRDRTKLHPRLQKKIEEFIKACDKAGLKVQITECLRTKAEQDALYAKGRTTGEKGKTVTNAPGYSYSSMHQWGVAFDYCRTDKPNAFDNVDGFFDKAGKIGKSLGLEWGGSWKSPVDKPHFQLPDWGSTPAILKRLYGTPEKFFATWSTKSDSTKSDSQKSDKDISMKTIKKGSTGKAVKVWQLIVGVSTDGDFGSATESATKKFQKAHGLTADGIVGNKTWKVGLESL